MAKKHSITVSQEPDVVRVVDDAELLDLDRSGLIWSSESGEYGTHAFPKPDEKADVESAGTVEQKPTARRKKES